MCIGPTGNSPAPAQARQPGPLSAWLQTIGPRIASGYAAMPLPVVVEATLAELTAAGLAFTAYDVTTALRALFPRRALPHYDRAGAPGVGPEVHRQMAAYLALGAYAARTVRPNGVDPARLYAPAKRRKGSARLLGFLPWSGPASGAPGLAPLPVRAWVIKDDV